MKLIELLKKVEGVHTIDSIMSLLKLPKKKAIFQVYKLRKKGYVKTKRLNDNKRVYYISLDNKLGGIKYEEIINTYAPTKIVIPKNYYIYRKNPSLEETFVYAIKTKSFRTIFAALSLFKKIDNWKLLYQLAKDNHVERQVGALYEVARKIMKTRRIDKHFINKALPKKKYKFNYIIPKLKSKDFKSIETKWRIYLPFNYKDLEDYK
tara:strand:+ start:15984 stop:16604 length:621 start_codon:yes stop_codon:yes gene_type:complete